MVGFCRQCQQKLQRPKRRFLLGTGSQKTGLDTQAITDCFNKDGVSLIEKEVALTETNKVQSSPTLLINGEIFPPESAYAQDGKGTLKIGKRWLPRIVIACPMFLRKPSVSVLNRLPKSVILSCPTPPGPNLPLAAVNAKT